MNTGTSFAWLVPNPLYIYLTLNRPFPGTMTGSCKALKTKNIRWGLGRCLRHVSKSRLFILSLFFFFFIYRLACLMPYFHNLHQYILHIEVKLVELNDSLLVCIYYFNNDIISCMFISLLFSKPYSPPLICFLGLKDI